MATTRATLGTQPVVGALKGQNDDEGAMSGHECIGTNALVWFCMADTGISTGVE